MAERRRLSARARIVGMTVLFVAAALAVTVLLLRQVLIAEQTRSVDRALEQEALELLEFVGAATRVADEPADVFTRRVLTDYLETNVTTRNETLLAIQDGTAFLQSSEPPGDVIALVDEFADVTVPTFLDLDSDSGPVRLLAQPLVDDTNQVGLLAIAEFTAERRAEISDTVRDAAVIAVAALLAAAVLAWYFAGRVLRPIGLLAETARDITEHDVTRRLPVQGADEIASLISSFNAMLDRLEEAMRTQREFLDDAGHELRTPITIMRGHLELADDDPRQLLESRDVVVGELDRMTRIVDELLLLARAEQVDFLRPQPIDIDAFLLSLFDRVRTVGDHRWVVDHVDVGVVVGDPDRLTQAMLNLAVNAARHTPAGSEIGIGGRFDGAEYAMWVRDTGEGIDPVDHERVFRRFARGATQRSGGSAGLGLAIVRAIAEAHDGRVTLDSRRGEGATFTIRLPVETVPIADQTPFTPPAPPAIPPQHDEEPSWHAS